MARDVFKEQIVKKEPTLKSKLIKAGVILFIVVVFFFIFPYTGEFTVIITAILGFAAYYFFGTLNVEYEYIFTNGELDIECIYSKSRRKRLYSGVVRDFEIMTHVDDKNHASAFNSAAETKDYSSGRTKDNTYAFLTAYKGKKLKIIIEPDDIMQQAFSTVITPRKFIKKHP